MNAETNTNAKPVFTFDLDAALDKVAEHPKTTAAVVISAAALAGYLIGAR